MNSTRRIFKNYLWTIANQILNMLFPLVTYGYAARILLADNLGQLAYRQSIVAYFAVITSFGLVFYGTREISRHSSSQAARSRVFWNLFSLKILTGAASLIVYFLLLIQSKTSDRMLPVVLSISIVSAVFNADWYFQGIEEFKWLAFRNLLVKGIGMISTLLLVRNMEDLVRFALVITLSDLSMNILMFSKVARSNPIANLEIQLSFHFKRSVFYLFSSLFIAISFQIQKTLIGTFLLKSDVGYYDAADKVFHISLVLISSLGPAAMARLSSESSSDKSKEDILKKTLSWQFFISCALSGILMLTSREIVRLLFGSSYDNASVLLLIMSLGLVPKAFVNWLAMSLLIPRKNEKGFLILFFLNAILVTLVTGIMMKYYGIVGVAVSAPVTEIVLLVFCLGFFGEYGLIYRIKASFRYITTAGTSLVAVSFVAGLLRLESGRFGLLSSLVSGFFFLAIYFLFLLLFTRDNITRGLIAMASKFIRRRTG